MGCQRGTRKPVNVMAIAVCPTVGMGYRDGLKSCIARLL